MQRLKKYTFLFLFFGIMGCEKEDLPGDIEEEEEEIIIPTFAIIGDNLVTGASGNVVTWDASYEMESTVNLQEVLGFQFGVLKNTIGSELAIAAGFPDTSAFLFYDVETGAQRTLDNYFFPENPVGNTFATNAQNSLLTYYLDNSSSCCNIYLNTFSQLTGATNEVYLGNANIAPVQLNVVTKANRTFAVAVDTFTNVKRIYIHNADTGESLGVYDISQYGGYIYNDARDELYLFDFNGDTLNHVTLDITTSVISDPTSFPPGFTVIDGFNSAQFSQEMMVFKATDGIISNIYTFENETIVTYNSTDLINVIFNETGIGLIINNTSVDFSTGNYIVMGTYQEDGQTKGITVALTLDQEVIAVAQSGDIRPNNVIFY